MPKIYGYARCSLAEERGQDLNRQCRELKAASAEEIITEREHGDAKVKPQLDFLLEHIEAGSTLIVCEVSRLSRSVLQFCEIMEIVKQKHLKLVVIGSITVDCRSGEMDPMSAAFRNAFASPYRFTRNRLRYTIHFRKWNAPIIWVASRNIVIFYTLIIETASHI